MPSQTTSRPQTDHEMVVTHGLQRSLAVSPNRLLTGGNPGIPGFFSTSRVGQDGPGLDQTGPSVGRVIGEQVVEDRRLGGSQGTELGWLLTDRRARSARLAGRSPSPHLAVDPVADRLQSGVGVVVEMGVVKVLTGSDVRGCIAVWVSVNLGVTEDLPPSGTAIEEDLALDVC